MRGLYVVALLALSTSAGTPELGRLANAQQADGSLTAPKTFDFGAADRRRRAQCGTYLDFKFVECLSEHDNNQKYFNSKSVGRLRIPEPNEREATCTAWKISDTLWITNRHCFYFNEGQKGIETDNLRLQIGDGCKTCKDPNNTTMKQRCDWDTTLNGDEDEPSANECTVYPQIYYGGSNDGGNLERLGEDFAIFQVKDCPLNDSIPPLRMELFPVRSEQPIYLMGFPMIKNYVQYLNEKASKRIYGKVITDTESHTSCQAIGYNGHIEQGGNKVERGQILGYACDTHPGNSGSPVFHKGTNNVIAIHSTFLGHNNDKCNQETNDGAKHWNVGVAAQELPGFGNIMVVENTYCTDYDDDWTKYDSMAACKQRCLKMNKSKGDFAEMNSKSRVYCIACQYHENKFYPVVSKAIEGTYSAKCSVGEASGSYIRMLSNFEAKEGVMKHCNENPRTGRNTYETEWGAMRNCLSDERCEGFEFDDRVDKYFTFRKPDKHNEENYGTCGDTNLSKADRLIDVENKFERSYVAFKASSKFTQEQLPVTGRNAQNEKITCYKNIKNGQVAEKDDAETARRRTEKNSFAGWNQETNGACATLARDGIRATRDDCEKQDICEWVEYEGKEGGASGAGSGEASGAVGSGAGGEGDGEKEIMGQCKTKAGLTCPNDICMNARTQCAEFGGDFIDHCESNLHCQRYIKANGDERCISRVLGKDIDDGNDNLVCDLEVTSQACTANKDCHWDENMAYCLPQSSCTSPFVAKDNENVNQCGGLENDGDWFNKPDKCWNNKAQEDYPTIVASFSSHNVDKAKMKDTTTAVCAGNLSHEHYPIMQCRSYDDPHIDTFEGVMWHFMHQGDYRFYRSNNGQLEIGLRYIWRSIHSKKKKIAYNAAVVMLGAQMCYRKVEIHRGFSGGGYNRCFLDDKEITNMTEAQASADLAKKGLTLPPHQNLYVWQRYLEAELGACNRICNFDFINQYTFKVYWEKRGSFEARGGSVYLNLPKLNTHEEDNPRNFNGDFIFGEFYDRENDEGLCTFEPTQTVDPNTVKVGDSVQARYGTGWSAASITKLTVVDGEKSASIKYVHSGITLDLPLHSIRKPATSVYGQNGAYTWKQWNWGAFTNQADWLANQGVFDKYQCDGNDADPFVLATREGNYQVMENSGAFCGTVGTQGEAAEGEEEEKHDDPMADCPEKVKNLANFYCARLCKVHQPLIDLIKGVSSADKSVLYGVEEYGGDCTDSNGNKKSGKDCAIDEYTNTLIVEKGNCAYDVCAMKQFMGDLADQYEAFNENDADLVEKILAKSDGDQLETMTEGGINCLKTTVDALDTIRAGVHEKVAGRTFPSDHALNQKNWDTFCNDPTKGTRGWHAWDGGCVIDTCMDKSKKIFGYDTCDQEDGEECQNCTESAPCGSDRQRTHGYICKKGDWQTHKGDYCANISKYEDINSSIKKIEGNGKSKVSGSYWKNREECMAAVANKWDKKHKKTKRVMRAIGCYKHYSPKSQDKPYWVIDQGVGCERGVNNEDTEIIWYKGSGFTNQARRVEDDDGDDLKEDGDNGGPAPIDTDGEGVKTDEDLKFDGEKQRRQEAMAMYIAHGQTAPEGGFQAPGADYSEKVGFQAPGADYSARVALRSASQQ